MFTRKRVSGHSKKVMDISLFHGSALTRTRMATFCQVGRVIFHPIRVRFDPKELRVYDVVWGVPV